MAGTESGVKFYDDAAIAFISKMTAKIIGGTKMTADEAKSLPLVVGGMTVDDAISAHLLECVTCRDVTEHAKPVRLGQKSGHCSTYWHLQLLRANYEGKINNIVAHTELGDEAPKMGQLE
jgi:hypothetical protein